MCSQLRFKFDESRGHFDKFGTKMEDVSTKVSILHLSKQDYKVVCENVIKRAFQGKKEWPGWMDADICASTTSAAAGPT